MQKLCVICSMQYVTIVSFRMNVVTEEVVCNINMHVRDEYVNVNECSDTARSNSRRVYMSV